MCKDILVWIIYSWPVLWTVFFRKLFEKIILFYLIYFNAFVCLRLFMIFFSWCRYKKMCGKLFFFITTQTWQTCGAWLILRMRCLHFRTLDMCVFQKNVHSGESLHVAWTYLWSQWYVFALTSVSTLWRYRIKNNCEIVHHYLTFFGSLFTSVSVLVHTARLTVSSIWLCKQYSEPFLGSV